MKLWTLPFRVLGILLLAVLVSGGWLFRRQLMHRVAPPQAAMQPERPAVPTSGTLSSARDKIDSLHGWSADSIVLSAREMAALVLDAVPPDARRHVDSVVFTLGEGQISATGRVETSAIPRAALGPLADALAPWERVSASGPVLDRGRGRAAWQVNAATIRGFTLPEAATHQLIAQSMPSVQDGALPFALPRGIARFRVRPTGVVLFREVQ